ncbi:MAG: hypothetical protein M9925_10105 [Chloroflexi bacterium]|nr:hypothetical protein [Chloroflexota bacterium]MCZ7577409.1 hypothetical protein [Dehalococcoidia bacterium]NJD66951.1 hypothetical protein [Chloroflexota bacterium]PWB43747.1 MAG: hypothetical protein C3F10_09945 [Dehalococcoidia bacterium]
MAIDTGDLLRTLRAKVGADEDPQRRHIWFKVRVGGVVVRTTMVSHGGPRQIGQPLLGRIARQLGLTAPQLEALVQCTLSADEYHWLITASEP